MLNVGGPAAQRTRGHCSLGPQNYPPRMKPAGKRALLTKYGLLPVINYRCKLFVLQQCMRGPKDMLRDEDEKKKRKEKKVSGQLGALA